MRILVDKDGTAARLQRVVIHRRPPRCPPTEKEFLAVVERFWHGPIWIAKHLRRGELWRVKTLAEAPRNALVLQMLEWHAGAEKGWESDTWDRGRFLEEWADPRAVNGVREIFGRCDAADTWRALFASMGVFRLLATETAHCLGYRYPLGLDQHVTDWVTGFRSEDASGAA
jgi:aminoglycoside 6-adenylyltransferase